MSFTTPQSCHTEVPAKVDQKEIIIKLYIYTSTPERYKPPQSRYKEKECKTLSTKISPCVVETPDQPVYCSVRP